MATMLWLRISLLLVSVIQGLAQTCPATQCRCEQSQGNWTINCSNKKLQAVPTFDVSETVWKSVLLNNNEFVAIPADAFSNIKVQEIDLSNNKISNVSHSAFSGQENILEKVDLSKNELTDLPNQLFRNFQKFKVLGLNSNRLTAPPNDVTTLEELYLNDNQFINFSSFPENYTAGLTSLKILGLGKNGFSDIPTNFFRPTNNLEVLDLSENQFTNFTDGVFSNLKQLRQLTFYKNSLTVESTDFLKEFSSSMEDLNIAYNKLTKIDLETFANFNKLVKLDLQFNEIVSIDKESMSGFPNLKWFSIYANGLQNISDDTFEVTPHLEEVNFGINELGRVPTVALQPLTKLNRLILWANKINQIGVDDLQIPVTGLEELNLGNNPFQSLPAEVFSAIKGLRYFDCSNGQLTQLPDTIFDGLDRLYGLMLSKNSFTSIPTGIKRLEGLQTLDLSDNDITEMKGDEFPGKEFNSLKIGSNPLSWLPRKIYHHPYLSLLDVANINITGVGYICDALNQKNLRSFFLENNPLHCDCEILWLRQKKTISRYWNQLRCASPPPLADRVISRLDESEFDCTMTIEEQCPNKGTVHFTSSVILLFMVCQSLTYMFFE